MDLSFSEIATILVVAIIVFGPKKIPEIARGLGQGLRSLRNATDEIKREIMKETEDINPVSDIQNEIKDFKDEIQSSTNYIDEHEGPIKR